MTVIPGARLRSAWTTAPASGRASSMPSGETLAAFAATGAVLAIHLSVHVAEHAPTPMQLWQQVQENVAATVRAVLAGKK